MPKPAPRATPLTISTKQNAGQIEGLNELAQRAERGDAIFPYPKGHRSECANGSEFHGDADNSEHNLGQGIDPIQHWLSARTRGGQGESAQQRHE